MKKFWALLAWLIFLPLNFSSAAEPDIAIGLVQNQFSAEVVAASDFVVTDNAGTTLSSLPKGKYFLNAANGKINIGTHSFGKDLILREKDAQKRFAVNKQTYRGRLQILLDSAKKLQVNNLVPLESYVQSVLGPKSSPIWPDEAIKAQAVAVRSFAYARMQSSDQTYALKASDQDMYYGGSVTENTLISKLASATKGEILYYGDAPALTYTTESSGGKTESAAVALGKNIPYLVSVQDYDEDSPSFKWTKTISVADVERILAQNGHKLGKLKSYRLTPLKEPYGEGRSATGRVLSMYLKGNDGDALLSGTELAAILNLNSTLFDVSATRVLPAKIDIPIENPYGMEIGRKEVPIKVNGDDEPRWKQVLPGYVLLNGAPDETLVFSGRGYGSGLGLSKWGARGMANNAPADQKDYYKVILEHYFPGTYLQKLY